MRLMRFILAMGLVAFLGAAHALGAGIKGRIQDRLGDSVDEHNQAIDDAMGNGGKAQPPAPVPAAGALKTGWLTRKSKDGKEVRVYFAYPAGLTKAKPAPAMIVLHESLGLNDDIEQRAQEFAGKGFYAIAPDLFAGKVTEDPVEAAKWQTALTNSGALASMKVGTDVLTEEIKNGVIDADHIGVIGWGMGGQQALLLALEDPRIKAVVIFYGPLVTDTARLQRLQGAVLGIFGGSDTSPSTAEVDRFKSGMKALNKTDVTIQNYEGVGHDFASRASKAGNYNQEKANDAWSKMWVWLDKKLPRK